MTETFVRENDVELLHIPKPFNEKACIMAKTKDVYQKMQNRWEKYASIDCISYFKCSKCKSWCYKGKCKVSCDHWHKLRLTSGEQTNFANNENTASINLLDHLGELIPANSNGKVGLVTYQNGINNNYEDHFSEMGKSIKSHLKEGVLCIGLYNQSNIVVPLDLLRMQCEFLGIRTEVVRSMRKMFASLAYRLAKIRPHPHWMHIAHSEGGRIVHDTLNGIPYNEQVFCQNQLIVLTYGSIQPVIKKSAKITVNTYSSADIAYKEYGTQCEGSSSYEIKVVRSLEKPFLPVPGDHGFLSATYQKALFDDIKVIRDFPGIYDAKN